MDKVVVVPTGGEPFVLHSDFERVIVFQQAQRGAAKDAEIGIGMSLANPRGLTTCEALWMGVPVITSPGQTFASRHSTSHLMNASLPQFVAPDLNGYVDLAVEWANRLGELSTMRLALRDQMRASPLMDAPQFAHDFRSLLHQALQSKSAPHS